MLGGDEQMKMSWGVDEARTSLQSETPGSGRSGVVEEVAGGEAWTDLVLS